MTGGPSASAAAARISTLDATPDFLVVGGGIVGLTIARSLHKRFPGVRVQVVEKEPECGVHASGKNSGVLHAGFYYTADSLKARFTAEGNATLKRFCAAHGIPVRSCGKLVLARTEQDAATFDVLLTRAAANGVELERVTPNEAREIEPHVNARHGALYSPATASVSPRLVMRALEDELRMDGIDIRTGTSFLRRQPSGDVITTAGRVSPGCVINAAGLHADRVASEFGAGSGYRLIPFRGFYVAAAPGRVPIRTHLYPVPDIDLPFLGVHFTVPADGGVKIGPSAHPVAWREQYRGIRNFRFGETVGSIAVWARLLRRRNAHLLRHALGEVAKLRKGAMVDAAAWMTTLHLRPADFEWKEPGIRAQLVHLESGALEMDFVIEAGERSLHVLNAVSPAFTCSFPFADHVVSQIGDA